MKPARITLDVTIERRSVGRRRVYDAACGGIEHAASSKAAALERVSEAVAALVADPCPIPSVYFAKDRSAWILCMFAPGEWGYMIASPDRRWPVSCVIGDREQARAALLAHLAQYDAPTPALVAERTATDLAMEAIAISDELARREVAE